jgi:hypothetical protein
MAKYILSSAGDINWMAVFSLVTFVAIFVIGSWTILRRDKRFIDHMAHLPLEDHLSSTLETDDTHEK